MQFAGLGVLSSSCWFQLSSRNEARYILYARSLNSFSPGCDPANARIPSCNFALGPADDLRSALGKLVLLLNGSLPTGEVDRLPVLVRSLNVLLR